MILCKFIVYDNLYMKLSQNTVYSQGYIFPHFRNILWNVTICIKCVLKVKELYTDL